MQKDRLVEIRKGETGTGLLIEHDGYISADCGENRKLFEEINAHVDGEFHCPKPFIVSAVFQKFGIENANGRIYPEDILKREVDKYQIKIREKRAIGECYRPEAMILTKTGWKFLNDVSEGEEIYTLNTSSNIIEIQPIIKIIKYERKGKMIHITSPFIDDVVTPDHGFPVYKGDKFMGFVTAQEILDGDCDADLEIPTSTWDKTYDDMYSLYGLFKANKIGELIAMEENYDGDVMCVEVENHTWFVMDNLKCHWTKNCNHPSESVIDLSRVAMNITELHWEGHTLLGKMEILVSEGFRRYGIISCQADQVAHLLLSGIKIGVSSRGLGTVQNRYGKLIVADDYEIVCWDVVSDPSTPDAWITEEDNIPRQYVESKSPEKSPLIEKLDKFTDWLIG